MNLQKVNELRLRLNQEASLMGKDKVVFNALGAMTRNKLHELREQGISGISQDISEDYLREQSTTR